MPSPILEELAEAYSSKMPAFDLVATYEAGMPIYRTRLHCAVLRQSTLPATAEFALRLISLGLDTELQITDALGLDPSFVRKALSLLAAQQLVHTRWKPDGSLYFAPSNLGRRVLDKELSDIYPRYLDVQIDALLGRLESYDPAILYSNEQLKKRDATLINIAPGTRPTPQSLNATLSELRLIFADENRDENPGIDVPDEQLMEVLTIERRWLLFKLVNVLLFRERDSAELHFLVFYGYDPDEDYGRILARRARDGARVVPDASLVPAVDYIPSAMVADILPHIDQVESREYRIEEARRDVAELEAAAPDATTLEGSTIITARTLRIQQLEQEVESLRANQGSSRTITVQQHRPLLRQALSEAQQYVLIISPWIKQDATDQEIISLIDKATRRGVYVLIGYGIDPHRGQTRQDALDPRVEEQFTKIKAGPGGSKFSYEYFKDTHEKILVWDNTSCVVTSFNWLSFRGDKGFRKETGIFSQEPSVINDLVSRTLPRFPAPICRALGLD